MKNSVYYFTTNLMNSQSLTFASLNGLPGTVLQLQVVKSVKDAIAAKDDEIMQVLLNSELSYFRLSYHYTLFASKLFKLCLYVSERPRHT